MSVAKCHLFSYLKKFQSKNNISSFVHIGQIHIDVPLRPMLIHGVVYRESKVIEQNILPEIKNFVIFEQDNETSNLNTSMNESSSDQNTNNNNTNNNNNNNNSGNQDIASDQTLTRPQIKIINEQKANQLNDLNDRTNDTTTTSAAITNKFKTNSSYNKPKHRGSMLKSSFLSKKDKTRKLNNNEFTFELKSKLDGCEIRAKLLENPCLKAAYLINNIELNALVTSECSKIACSMNSHCLSFQCDDIKTPKSSPCVPLDQRHDEDNMMTMNPLDDRTIFDLPSISVVGTYLYNQTDLYDSSKLKKDSILTTNSNKAKSISLNTHNKDTIITKYYSSIDFHFKVSPLTRELNAEVIAQLVFVTKVFIKEINNILQAVYTFDYEQTEKLTNNETYSKENSFQKHLLNQNTNTYFYYDLKLNVGKISLTGHTPTNTVSFLLLNFYLLQPDRIFNGVL
jgi:hypothetical protein